MDVSLPSTRAFSRGDTVYDPWHYVPVLARKPGALRNGAPFKDWVLPAAIERIRRRLASTDDGNRQMVDILNAVLTDGLPAVEAACAEALSHGVHSADVVLNILARQREPAPPVNIMTPAAPTLRHAPIADCARYDNLRNRPSPPQRARLESSDGLAVPLATSAIVVVTEKGPEIVLKIVLHFPASELTP
ncbi:hypothetical protein ACVW1A_000299 [Bradyrhizobium sp. LB1.3]